MTPLVSPEAPTTAIAAGWFQRVLRSGLERRLTTLRWGSITLSESWSERSTTFGAPSGPAVTLRVHDPAFYADVALRGSIGAAEAYAAGRWGCDRPTELVRVFVRNRDVLDGVESGLARISAPLQKLMHALRPNTRRGSRRNIAAHYDLGNDFFERFLDTTLSYSSALFVRPDMTLEQAQVAKLDRLCRKLGLRPGLHLLEVGTGWGALAIHAARHYGCRVTTTTISRAQHDVAAQRIAAAGLSDRITLRLDDYRDLTGQYDRVVSVEMIEAVGAPFLDGYVAKLASLLAPDGLLALQAITIQDQHYAQALGEVDFIKRHIFPGSFIPCATAILDATTRASDLRLLQLEDFGPHYAETLHRWHENLLANWDAILDLGYDEAFLRLWEWYLCYCEGGFAERFLGVSQLLFARPLARPEPWLPAAG